MHYLSNTMFHLDVSIVFPYGSGHKGYLRELERGPLGYSDAQLFKNCELRVYRLILDVINDAPDSSTSSSIVAERIASSLVSDGFVDPEP